METQQLPLLEKLYKLPTDTQGTFHSEVYYFNKVVQMAIKWGTPEKVRFIDPLTGVPLDLGASGELNLMVADSRRLLLKLVGTMQGISWDGGAGQAKSLQAAFRPLITSAVKANLSAVIKESALDLLVIDEHLDQIGNRLQEKLLPGFAEYGLTIPQFYVTSLVLPESDPNFKRIRELHTITLQTRVIQAEATVKTAQAQAKAEYRTAEEASAAAIEAARREVELQRQTTETEVARREAEWQDQTAHADIEVMRTLQSQASSISAQCQDPALRNALTSLAERFRFSDPVSSAQTAAAEADLAEMTDLLQTAVMERDPDSALVLVSQIETALAKRNELCKLSKRAKS